MSLNTIQFRFAHRKKTYDTNQTPPFTYIVVGSLLNREKCLRALLWSKQQFTFIAKDSRAIVRCAWLSSGSYTVLLLFCVYCDAAHSPL